MEPKMEEKTVLAPETLQKSLGVKGKFGAWLSRRIFKLLEIDKVNAVQAKLSDYEGPAFSEKALKELGISYELPAEQLANIPLEGGFITVSDHHFGAADGMILNAVVGKIRPDYKLLTTFLLALIPSLKDYFLPVDNLSGKTDARSVNGIRAALQHIADGGAIGFFPAGEVATWQHGKNKTTKGCGVIEDKPWAKNIVKLVKKSNLPVIPIYFHGTNSLSFHLLGQIHRRLRTVRLIHEVFNKRGTVIPVRIGKPILPEETKDLSLEEFGKLLRERCYEMESSCTIQK